MRAAALVPGDVIADATGDALAVVGGCGSFGTVIVYVRATDARRHGATDRAYFTPRQLVRRAITAPGAVTSDRAVLAVETTTQ